MMPSGLELLFLLELLLLFLMCYWWLIILGHVVGEVNTSPTVDGAIVSGVVVSTVHSVFVPIA